MSTAAELRRTINDLLANQPDDLRLRDHLEGLRRERHLAGMTWFWGPLLYRRNRVVFREFILTHFSEFEGNIWRSWRRVKWSEHATGLEGWLAEARQNRDTWLVRRLLTWKFGNEHWGVDSDAWRRELAIQYRAAKTPAAQAVVLEEFDAWFELDESAALDLYAVNPACRWFLLKHLPRQYSFWGGREKREMWRKMIAATLAANDDELAMAIYRRQVDLKQWESDIERLARDVSNPDRLCDELRKRHPEGWGLKLGAGALKLLRLRGRAVMPYIREKLNTIVGGWYGSAPDAILELAQQSGWWNLWAAVVRTAHQPKHFNQEVGRLLDDAALDDATRLERLRALAGVSQEWNWPGAGFARVHSLEDGLAARLYERYPAIVRGPFKPHVVPTSWQGGPKLLAAAQRAADDEMVDLLASRYVARPKYEYAWAVKEQAAIMRAAEELAASLESLRDRDEAAFARRAANILTQVPAFSIYNYELLLRTNSLARLLFVRSFSAFLSVPDAVRDLIEGSEVHVQMLAYRVLAEADERARTLAAESLDILQGTLLRPLHRKTRLAAFGALANAAHADRGAAARVLRRAREALCLPDKRYPKEDLVGLIGQVLHAWPELRGPRERPIIYGLEEALA